MKIITFSFVNDRPPTDATVVIDCRLLPDADISKPLAQEKLAEARRHLATDAVIAFGCGFGESRSVAVAERFAKEAAVLFSVEIEHRGLRRPPYRF